MVSPSRFTLDIDMGNIDMSSTLDVRDALIKVVRDIENYNLTVGHTSSIIDVNGNRVGSWKFHKEGWE